jgi:DNA-binding transcriptional regulator YdaS (Cro superfamily)
MKPEDLLAHYKNQAAIARALDVEQPSVCVWFKNGSIPPIRQLQIEEVTRGAIKADPSIPRGWPKRKAA